MLPPERVHFGKADEVIAKRQAVLDLQYAARSQRFVNKSQKHPTLPKAVFINPSDEVSKEQSASVANAQ